MTKHIHPARSAAAAIAAAAALGSTGLAAQTAPTSAQPPLVQPAPAQPADLPTTNAQPVPVLTLPEPSSLPPVLTLPEPEPSSAVLSEPVAEQAAPAPAPQASTTGSTQRRAASQAQPAAEQAEAPGEPLSADADNAAADNADITLIPPVAEAPATTDPAFTDNSDAGTADPMTPLAYLVAALAAIGLLIWFAFRRRKPKGRFAKSAAKPQASAAPVAETPASMSEPAPEPMMAAPAAEPAASKQKVAVGYADTVAPMPMRRSATGAAVALPRELPESYEERDALLQRMIAAEPDRANPFRSRKQRLKRARLILQSLGRSFEHADPWIDLSQYPDVWPELARRKYPQAA